MNINNRQVLKYLYHLSRSEKIIAGQHNQESKNKKPFNPALSTENIHKITGKYPGLWSGDFLYQKGYTDDNTRMKMIHEAERQWRSGAIVNIMWHACPPTQNEPCQWEGGVIRSKKQEKHLTDRQWHELITDGTRLNKIWKLRLNTIAKYLEYLRKRGVEVLWRPFHEMNQGKFWWGGRPQYIKQLYRITYHYLVNKYGLTNLIWVWNLQDFESLSNDLRNYNPGTHYWDIASLDIYGSDGFTQRKYHALATIAGNKPIAIGECIRLPTAKILHEQPRWVFFMGWAEDVFRNNSRQKIQALYNFPNVLTRLEVSRRQY